MALTKFKVFIEATAERDLFAILLYIADSLKESVLARRIYFSIKEQILTLSKLPFRYKVLEEEPYASQGVRRMPVENYLVFYVADAQKNEVHVLRVLYNRREWRNLL